MITISAFADEISIDLDQQMRVCESQGVRNIDIRGIEGRNVSTFSMDQAREYSRRLRDRGFSVPCIGSPIGKISIADDFDKHLDLLKRCCDIASAFETNRLRVFSFYASPGANILQQRRDVMYRLEAMVKVAQDHDVILYHENEKGIYGAKPQQVRDILETIKCEQLKGVFDPANYVEEGLRPFDDAWQQGLAELTDYFHIKDKRVGAEVCCPAGEGDGQIGEILADAANRKFEGFATLEPHMAVAGQFSGFTGPELFAKAASALKRLLEEAGLKYA